MGNFQKNIIAQQKLLKKAGNRARGAMGEKIEQMLSANQVLCLTLEKVLAQAIAYIQQEDALRRLRGMYWFSKNYVEWRWKVE